MDGNKKTPPANETETSAVDLAEKEGDEGGIEAWSTVIGSFLVFFASFGFINSFGFFQDYYKREMLSDYAESTIALVGTLQITLLYLFGPLAGALFDSYGLTYLYPVSAVACLSSMLALSFANDQAWQFFLTQGVAFGLFVAFGLQPAIIVAGQHFKKKRALVMGMVTGGSSLGAVCFSIMFARLIPSIGFAWSIRVGGLVLFCCYSIAIAISRTKQVSKPTNSLSLSKLLDFRGFKDPRYFALAMGNSIGSLGLYIPYYYIEKYMTASQPSANIAPYLLPLLNIGSFFGRIIGGQLADRFGRLDILCPMTILSGVSCFAIWLPFTHVAPIVLFVCVYGFASGVFISVAPAVVGEICPEDTLGARMGAFFSVTAISTLVGTPIGGVLLTVGGSSAEGFRWLIVFAGVTLIIGGIILCLGKILCERKQSKR